jgi:ABC-type bacteriocin/lantibiotic exporter with double-glycine peptidase domain
LKRSFENNSWKLFMGEVKNTKLIAKNTLALYFRMLLTLCISLYTARVILAALGFSDYGLYNVVGGILALFTFINGSLISSTQRFISFAIGKGDKEYLNTVFNTTVRLQYAFASLDISYR